jgi:cation:H+ antiporter
MDVGILLVSLVVILIGAELFTNGVEWFGHRLNLAEGAVGSVLAAVGTALPETIIPIIAIVFTQSASADEVGIGAILGAPFMLATLAMFVTGAAIFAFRRRRPTGTVARVDLGVLGRDARAFLVTYSVAIGAAFLPPPFRPYLWLVAIGLLVLYALYVRSHLREERDADLEDPGPLRLHRLDPVGRRVPEEPPRLWVVVLQVVVALTCIIVGAAFFVGAVDRIAVGLGVDATLLALVIAPIATELPEKFNSVIWVRQGKDNLALGNITGAMVFQSAIPPSVALVFAPEAWTISEGSAIAFLSAGIAVLSLGAIVLPALARRRLTGSSLLVGGAFYLVYLGIVIASMEGAA